MIYTNKFVLPDEDAEFGVIDGEKRTCFNTFYPFKIFPQKGLQEVRFDGITIFYGGNGSGKSTLINVMAQKVGAIRFSEFNDAPFFDQYVDICSIDYISRPPKSYVLTSDDVFNYVLNARYVNETLDSKRNELFDNYAAVHKEAILDPSVARIKGMDDLERWSDVAEILSPRRSQSSYIKKRVAKEVDLRSNGETAFRYFLARIDEGALYFLDEPENSLSVEFQIKLADYIAATARATQSQFVIATHSPILLAMRGARIYNLDAYPASVCDWTELPNVRRYFDFFMEHREEF